MRAIVIVFICMGVLWGKNTLIMAVSENIGALNPQGYQGNAMFAQNAIYEGLVRVDKQGKIVPSLALSWNTSQDGLSYEFVLRKGVKFSNGEAFNADAVVLNFQSILKNRARHSWSGLAMAIKDMQKVSEYKVRLLLKHPYSPTLNELSVVRPFRFLAPSAMPKDLDLLQHNPKPIGTGAYMLGKSKLGVSDTLLKNPHYWNQDAYNGIYYDEIILKVIFDPNAKLAALKSKQIDMIYGYDQIPLEIFKNMQNDKHFNTYLSPPIYSTILVINSASPILTLSNEKFSQNLRKAIALGIDKTKITQAVYGGLQEKADTLFAPNIFHSLSSYDILKILPYKPKEAQNAIVLLLQDSQAALLRDRGVEILFSGDNPAHKMIAEILQSEFKAIGIKARLSASEPTIYRNRLLKGAFDIAFSETWGAPYEPLSILYSMLIPSHIDFVAQAGLSQKPHIDKLIREIIALNPHSKVFYSALSEVIALLQESGVYIPLTYQRNKVIAHKKIKGIKMGVVGYEVPFWEMYE